MYRNIAINSVSFKIAAVLILTFVSGYPAFAQNTFPNVGNVGIGTTTPNHELVVQGNDPAIQIRDGVTNNSANAARSYWSALMEISMGVLFSGGTAKATGFSLARRTAAQTQMCS